MSKILVKFHNAPVLRLKIEDSEIGSNYVNLVKKNYLREKPIYRDSLKYTKEYMRELGNHARETFGWSWDLHTDFDTGIAPILHKNIETLVGNGFDAIPEEHDHLVHELHYCLHLIQNGIKTHRPTWLQIEWFNDDGFNLPSTFKFKDYMETGDVKLQNPLVGHGPLQIFEEQDGINISQTCKFHTIVKPGINIIQHDYIKFTKHRELLDFFIKHDPAFVELHGPEKILHYTGYPVIGKVENLDDLDIALNCKELKFDSLDFE
jgi:hypothetical protein